MSITSSNMGFEEQNAGYPVLAKCIYYKTVTTLGNFEAKSVILFSILEPKATWEM